MGEYNIKQLDNPKPDGFVGEKIIIIPQNIIAEYKKNIFVERLYITAIGYFPEVKRHFRKCPQGVDEYIFFYCILGKGVVKIDSRSFMLTKNTAICILRHAPHSYYSSDEDPWSILWVYFNGTDTLFYPLENAKQISFTSAYASNRMLFLFNQIFHIIDRQYTLGNFIYISPTLQMILSETYYKDELGLDYGQHNKYLNAIIKYFNSNISQNITL